MKESFKNWWSALEDHEKNALIVLCVISAGIFLFTLGISVGRAVAALI